MARAPDGRGDAMSRRRFLTFTVACVVLYYLVPLVERLYPPEVKVGLVLLVLGNAVAVLALCAGFSLTTRPAWPFPLLAAALFVPSVYVHYNESALVYTIFYLLVGGVGVGIGLTIRALRRS